jgi:hypothetical protein
MDPEAVEWMIDHLERHLDALKDNDFRRQSEQIEGLAVSGRILEQVLPTERFALDPLEDEAWRWQGQIAIAKALGLLRNQAQIVKYLGPSGPSMPADGLHPTVWANAATLWRDGHYGPAVGRAATFLNAHIQDRSTRTDLSDKRLMQEVFSPEPPKAGKPRLRWQGDVTPNTRSSMREGLLHYAIGAFMAIRNPVTHETAGVDKQVALEQLAALSVLARWVDSCELQTDVSAERNQSQR